MVERYTAYDNFAWFYNRYWGVREVEMFLPTLDRLLLSHVPPPANLLDLACGTGQLTAVLLARGYEVAGVDASEEMLRFAERNAPDATYHVADLRDFDLGRTFDAAYCTFDSLNHIMSLGELSTAFTNVRKHLRAGGSFQFDLNMHEGFLARWKGEYSIVETDHVLLTRSSYDADSRIATMRVTMFRADQNLQRWKREDLVFEQRAYTPEEISGALSTAGFSGTGMFDKDGSPGWKGVGRLFCLATA